MLFRSKGYVPTRYSPVCHSRIATSVRLACVKPAASVRSEPGSNSQVQEFKPASGHASNLTRSLQQSNLTARSSKNTFHQGNVPSAFMLLSAIRTCVPTTAANTPPATFPFLPIHLSKNREPKPSTPHQTNVAIATFSRQKCRPALHLQNAETTARQNYAQIIPLETIRTGRSQTGPARKPPDLPSTRTANQPINSSSITGQQLSVSAPSPQRRRR